MSINFSTIFGQKSIYRANTATANPIANNSNSILADPFGLSYFSIFGNSMQDQIQDPFQLQLRLFESYLNNPLERMLQKHAFNDNFNTNTNLEIGRAHV